MRCGMLHQGRLQGLKGGIKKVVLVPGGGAVFVDCTVNHETYIYSVKAFCVNMNRAVVAWYEANQNDGRVIKNTGELMQYRDGVYEFQGRTVIA